MATKSEGFVTFVQGILVRVKCRDKNIHNFTQANFTLEGDRVKTRCLFNYLQVYVVIKLLIMDVPDVFTEGGILPPVFMCERSIMCPVSLFKEISVYESAKYQCTQCDYKFTHKNNIKQHVMSVHKSVKYHCNKCTATNFIQWCHIRPPPLVSF